VTLARALAALAAAAVLAAAAALAGHATPTPDRVAVGLRPGADTERVVRELRRLGASVERLAPLPALIVETRDRAALRRVGGVRYVERLRRRAAAFTPNDPLVGRQWYLSRIRAYDAWPALPPLPAVRVAVIDSGADLGHPELRSRVAAAKSFVGGTAHDTSGHGTIVAGIIAAEVENAVGIAGLAPSAELLVAKVVGRDGAISVEAEARAIRWAVQHGARVINMSLGGVRHPFDRGIDTYSRLEADAIAFAVSRGAVVVAAVGNGDQSPSQPWRFASYPAALPHVLGVGAIARSGESPRYSNRDPLYVDVVAPGDDILSTFPRRLTVKRPTCPEQGYTPCATDDFRPVEGTSFAAPQASAAAATLIATRPDLRPEQVTALLQRSAVDAARSTGCTRCGPGRDAFTGWGTLDVTGALAALAESTPAADALETNDDVGSRAYRLYGPWPRRLVVATLDYWDDADDVYGVYLRAADRLEAELTGEAGAPALALWGPDATSLTDPWGKRARLRFAAQRRTQSRIGYTAPAPGWYAVQARLTSPGEMRYTLTLTRSRPVVAGT
jgi:subtilisin family serine protease